ncbi:MAG: peptide ABC transporter substrate-binding protein [Verrucomicrobiota bacterium]
MPRGIFSLVTVFVTVVFLFAGGCSKRRTRVEVGDREQILHVGNGGEPSDLDPHTAIGEIEHDVMIALFEGLVTGDPKDVSPQPGVAENWDVSEDGLIYTFHLRDDARWSNGEPVTANDFLESYHRALLPSLGNQYSYMLFPVKNAEEFNTGKITDFNAVGFKVIDERTFQITLHSPTPYFLSLIIHNSWYPVNIASIKKYGPLDSRNNRWTRPQNFVGNGPFVLKEWKLNSHILVEKNPKYWDAKNVRLNKIYFYPTESYDTEERMFRAGQLHTIRECPQAKIAGYVKNHPDLINIYPLLTTYYYRFNTKRPPFNDQRVRLALTMAIDRKSIVENVTRGGQLPAFNLTPPDTGGYTSAAKISENVKKARQLLAEAGFPDGKDFPKFELLFNTLESHRAIAEAIQQMWKKNLNIEVTLRNEEWKVYLDSTHRMDYFITRAGWGGDYADPNTFLDLMLTDGGNNETGWSNAEYDRLIKEAGSTRDQAKRFAAFQKAEAILMDEVPIMPIYFYTRPRLIRPSVQGYLPNLLDQHPFNRVYLDPTGETR